jgi:K+-transporting ATPase KdpF subunit
MPMTLESTVSLALAAAALLYLLYALLRPEKL